MKAMRLIPLLVTCLVARYSLKAQAPDYSKLVSLWRLNNSPNDNYNTNNATWVGTATYMTGPRAGVQAASLNGSSYLKITNQAPFNFEYNQPFSACAWIKCAGQDTAIIGKMISGGTYRGWELHNPNGNPLVYIINTYGTYHIQVQTTGKSVQDNNWHHIAFTYDGSTLASGVKIYVDGTLASTTTSKDTLGARTIANTVNLDLGTRQDGAAHYFNGALYEEAVWRTSLAASDITYIYTNGITPPVLVTNFIATPTTLYAGQTAVLRWEVEPGTSVSLDQGIGDLTALTTNGIGTRTVTVEGTTTYTLTATKTSRPTEVKLATVTVNSHVASFLTNRKQVPPGGVATLSWVINPLAQHAVITPGVGDVSGLTTNGSGLVNVAPSATTTYTLSVDRNGVTNTAQVTVTVQTLLASVPPSQNNLVSLWPLNGNTLDAQGTNNGIYTGTTSYTVGPKPAVQAASLNGASYIRAGTNIVFDRITAFSATAWVKGPAYRPGSVLNDTAIIGKMITASPYAGWEMHANANVAGLGAGVLNVWIINNYGANYIQVNTTNLVFDDTWHHVAFTYDGSGSASGVKVYVDGSSITTSNAANSLTGSITNSGELTIGSRQNAQIFLGAVDEASMWNTALSPENIFFIYTNGIPAPLASFTASTNLVYAGQTVTLSWQGDLGSTVSIDQGIADVTTLTTNGVGSVQVAPETTTTYTITASKDGYVRSKQLVVTVRPAITSFTTSRKQLPRGASANLSWVVSPLVGVSLSPGVGDVSGFTTNGIGSLDVSPVATTTYTLTTARNGVTNLVQLTVVVTEPQPATWPDLAGLVSLWRLNGDTLDSRGTNHGQFVGTTNFVAGPRYALLAAGLNGASYIKTGTNFSTDTATPFSVSAWIKGPLAQDSAIISKMMSASPYTGWELHVGTGDNGSGQGLLNVWLINAYGSRFIQVNSPVTVLDDTWHHVAFTYDGTGRAAGVRIYVDGLDATCMNAVDTLSGTLANAIELNLGSRNNGAQHRFTGAIQEAALWNTALSASEIGSIYQSTIASPTGAVVMVVEPSSRTVTELAPVSLSGLAYGALPINYQWLRNGAIVPNATNRTISFTAMLGDDGAQFSLAATNVFSNTTFVAISSNATLSVIADTNPPTVLWAQGRTLSGAQVKFSEPLRAETATNLANLSLAGTNGPLVISDATLSTDGTLLSLTTEPQTFGAIYTLTMNGVVDRAAASNAVTPNAVSFAAVPFITDNIGGDTANGVLSFTGGVYTLTAGGAGVLSTNDQLAFSFQARNGDFDVRVRVAGLTAVDVWSRAALVAREDTSASGRSVAAVATPTLAGCFLEWRDPVGAAFQRTGSYPPNLPDLWLRLRRVSNVFTAFAGTDGAGWFRLGDATVALSTNVLLGFGVASGTSTPATAWLSDFGDNPSTATALLPDLEPPGPSSRHTPIAITEIHYHPAPRADSNDVEFIELFNSNPWAEDISGWRLSGDISFTFPANTSMAGGSYLVVANAPADVTAVYGLTNVFGPYGNRLKSSGTVRLRNEQDAVMLEVNYDNKPPWPVAPDGSGLSLVLRRPSFGEGDPRAWDQSDHVGGSPGAFDSLSVDPQRGVVINEFLANSELPLTDFVELFNASGRAVDLSGAWLSDDPGTNKFRIPDGTVLVAGGFVSFDEATLGFSLSSDGEEILLVNSNRTRVLDSMRFGAQAFNISFGRAPDGGPLWGELAALTPGSTNSPPLQREIVINEIMFRPISGANNDEFIELFNRGTNSVDLAGWRLNGGVDFIFSNSVVVAPGGFVVVAKNLTNLLAKYPALSTENTFGNYSGALSDSGERITLQMPVQIVKTNGLGGFVTNTAHATVNEVTYRDGGRWGAQGAGQSWSDGGGSSLELVDVRADNRLPANWAGSDETVKAPWTIAEATGYLDLGTTYNGTPIDRLELIAMGAGEFLVDDVEVRQSNGPNLLADGAFESGLGAWVPQGNHIRSTISAAGAGYGGGFALHVRASADGDIGANRIRVPLTSALTAGQVCTIRAKVRWLKGFPELVFRVKGNYHELYVRCNLPANLGTPGASNSRAVANVGPTMEDVKFAPVLPTAGEPVVVAARAYDPDGVASLMLNWRADPALSYTSVAMRDDGTGGDAVAGDGLFSATIPGQSANMLVAFFVQATDAAAAPVTSVFPADAPTNECLVRFGEAALASPFGTYRLWLTATNVSRWSNRPFLDNEPLPGTFVLGNFRAIHCAQGRYAGSAAHQTYAASPVTGTASFAVDFPADDRLLGTDSLQKLHAPGNAPGSDTTLVAEPLQYQFVRRLGLPWMHLRHVAWVVNGNRQGLLLQDMETPNGDVVNSRFPDDKSGQLLKAMIRYEFDNVTNVGAVGAGVQWFGGVSHGAATLNNYVTTNVSTGLPERKSAPFRWTFLPRGDRETANDYGSLFALVDAATNAASTGLRGLVDINEWARHCAAEHAANNWDSFAAENGQNMYLYKDTGTTWRWLPFDRSIVFSGSTSYDLFVGHTYFPDPPFNALEAQPDFRRCWWVAYRELATQWLAPEVFHSWLDSRSSAFASAGVSAASTSATKSWIAARRTFIQQALAGVDVPFGNSASFIATETNQVLLTGTAAPWVAAITANGRALALQWTTVTNWQALITVRAGTNVVILAGLDAAGLPLSNATAQVTIAFTGTNAWPALRINEWMADNSGFIRDPADNDKEDWFELFNPTDTDVDLSSWSVTDMTTNAARFIVPSGYIVPAHGFLLVWADGEPEQNSTNRADLHVNFKLEKDGEAIALYAPDGALIDMVTFGPQMNDISMGRWPDGSTNVTFLTTPTPRGSNQEPVLLVVGQVELEGYVGLNGNGAGTRLVVFKATDDAGTVLREWSVTLNMTMGASGSGVGGFTLTNVPAAATHLSAKTAWNLRKRVTLTLNGGQLLGDFTGNNLLPAGDLDSLNMVDSGDFNQLAAAWYTSDPASDVDGSGWVDLDDYFLLANRWSQTGDVE